MAERRDVHDPLVDDAEEAAAEEAAEIGGPDPEPGVDPAQRAVVEGGEGWAEGFEEAEAELERNASHEDRGANPMRDAGRDEEDAGSTYGEADHSGAQGDDS
jgi:hypothetical protein